MITGLLLILTSCAAGPNDLAGGPGAAGFWLGLWQGLISPITFIVSLFNDKVNIYEVNNNGNWYNFGFMLGVARFFSDPSRPREGDRTSCPRRTPRGC